MPQFHLPVYGARGSRCARIEPLIISPEELVLRARKRCQQHRQPRVGGFCRECYLAELEEAIAEAHPEMKRGDVFDLVSEWLRTEDDSLQ